MNDTSLILVVVVISGLIMLVSLVIFLRTFSLWLQAFVAGARISIPEILAMKLRRSPVREIVQLRIMAVQAGLSVPTHKIEAAALAGADVERAVRGLIRAKELEMEVTWEELIHHDLDEHQRPKPTHY